MKTTIKISKKGKEMENLQNVTMDLGTSKDEVGIELNVEPKTRGFKKRKGMFAANFSPMAIAFFILIATVIGVVFVSSISSMLTSSKLQTAIDEVSDIDSVMKAYSINGTSNGSGYKNASAATVVPYSDKGLKLDTAGTLIQSKTSYGSKIKYQVAANGATAESYNLLVDASGAWDGWDAEQKIKYVTSVARNFQKLNMRTTDEIGNVINMAGADATTVTTLPANSTAVAAATISGDADGKFTVVYLGK